MVLLDIDMPDNCRECPLRESGRFSYSNANYCMPMLGRRIKGSIYSGRPNWCPLKRNIIEEVNNVECKPK